MKKKAQATFLFAALAALLLGAIFLPGTQPGQGRTLDDPSNCGCHATYDPDVEPMFNWHGSMMSQAGRDPIFFAGLDLANFDLSDAGSFCLRCHSPAGYKNGTAATDPSGATLSGTELEGVFCDFCHAQVDPLSAEGNSLVEPDVTSYGNAMWVITNGTERRGPYDVTEARHPILYSPFHRESEVCASCHDVSNPLLCDPNDPYNVQKCVPEQRTYSEWANSWYATQGEPGNCQSCHNPHVKDGFACKQAKNIRTFLPVHHMNGANTFVPDALAVLQAGNKAIDFTALAAGKQRAINMLHNAATLEAFDETDLAPSRLDVRITNLTGHKLPTGYPEGRRMWINLVARNAAGATVFESGHYDSANAWLIDDPQIKIYENHFGVEQPDGSCQFSFRLVRNNCIEKDNRIPPKGFDNTAFQAVGAGHVHYHYDDGQFWDDTPYLLPPSAASVDVKLYYQTTTREYVEFLASAEGSGTRGANLLSAYNSVGRAAPVLMDTVSIVIDADHDGMGDAWELANGFNPADPADADGDDDGDGLSNLEEYLTGTLPDNPDSDGGGENDGSEFHGGRDPLDPADDGQFAAYSPSFTAPECATGKSPCMVPAALINGRDSIPGGAEPDSPNTLAASACLDGATGSYHTDESLDAFMVTDLSGDFFTAGDTVRLDATVWCWTDVGWDVLYVYQADSASSPAWNYAGSAVCSAIGEQTLSVVFNLGAAVGTQAVRAAFTYDSPPASCDAVPYNDRDDVALAVAGEADSDGDGLSDADELNIYGTDPLLWDTDGDMIPDSYEVAHVASSPPLDPLDPSDGNSSFEPARDCDGNPNYHEYWNHSDPWSFDPAPNPLFPDSPGCYYWGEADGDGYAQSLDKTALLSQILGIPQAYDNVLPRETPDAQDLDADGFIQFGDLNILKNFVLQAPVAGVNSRPASLEKVYDPATDVVVGSTTHITVRVRNENTDNNLYQAGFAVVFSLDPSSTGSAVLLGGDGSYGPGTRYDVSGPSGAADGGHATITMKITAPGTVIVNATVPACGISGVGKYMDEVQLTTPFLITGI